MINNDHRDIGTNHTGNPRRCSYFNQTEKLRSLLLELIALFDATLCIVMRHIVSQEILSPKRSKPKPRKADIFQREKIGFVTKSRIFQTFRLFSSQKLIKVKNITLFNKKTSITPENNQLFLRKSLEMGVKKTTSGFEKYQLPPSLWVNLELFERILKRA